MEPVAKPQSGFASGVLRSAQNSRLIGSGSKRGVCAERGGHKAITLVPMRHNSPALQKKSGFYIKK
jgi:hypothetical protein